MSTITTRAGKGSPLTNNEVDANFTNLNTDKAELSGAAFTGAITTTSTVDGRDVATDGTKLDGIEAGATADQTAAEIKTAYESNADTNAFTDADESKLDGIEAGADVTDTTNVTAAGALMDSELTSIASVKALNQGVATTDSPTFAGLTSTGEITANGGIALGDNDKATFGAGDDLQIYHDGSTSFIKDAGTGNLIIQATDLQIANADNTANYIRAFNGGAVDLRYAGAAKLATTSTGIDVTGTATMDGLNVDGTITAYGLNFDVSDGVEINALESIVFDIDSDNNQTNRVFQVKANNSTPLFTIQEAGNVGIGKTPDTNFGGYVLQLNGGSQTFMSFGNSTAGTTLSDGLVIGCDSNGADIYQREAQPLRFHTSNTERMRIDSAGNLLVGKTVNDLTTDGIVLRGSGELFVTRANDVAAFNRRSSDGNIVTFRRDGTSVGSIGTSTGGLYIADAGVGFRFDSGGTDDIIPCNATGGAADASINLGSSGARFQDLYLSGTVTSTGFGSQLATTSFVQNAITTTVGSSSGAFIRMAVSNAGNPTYAFDGDTDTGVFTSGANTLNFTTAGSERMRIDSAGDLIKVGGVIKGERGTAAAPAYSFSDDTDTGMFNISNLHLGFSVGGSERMRIDASGEVVITSSAAPIAPTIKHSGQTGDLAKLRIINRSGQSINKGGLLELGGITNDENTRSDIFASVAGLKANSASNNRTGYMQFSVSNGSSLSEAMRIDSAGNLLVGTTSVPTTNTQGIGFVNSAGFMTLNTSNNQTGTTNAVILYNANGLVGTIQTSGSSTLYNTSSDQRLKENIADADDAGSKIDAIQVRQYDWKADGSHQDYGMIAQELQAVAPEAVSGDADSEEMMGVDYSKLVPMLIKEIQSLRNRVAQLEE